jgi:type II secretory pathway pseudopilin PulG
MKRPPSRTGFSLVEVTVALGLVTFCLMALIGLLPIGLDSVRNSTAESGAINCMEQIAGAIRNGLPDANQPQTYRAAGAYGDLTWTLGAPAISTTLENLSASGIPSSNPRDRQFAAHVELTPPKVAQHPPKVAQQFQAGTASIDIAWPAQATWDTANSRWSNAQGNVQTWVVFLPAQ